MQPSYRNPILLPNLQPQLSLSPTFKEFGCLSHLSTKTTLVRPVRTSEFIYFLLGGGERYVVWLCWLLSHPSVQNLGPFRRLKSPAMNVTLCCLHTADPMLVDFLFRAGAPTSKVYMKILGKILGSGGGWEQNWGWACQDRAVTLLLPLPTTRWLQILNQLTENQLTAQAPENQYIQKRQLLPSSTFPFPQIFYLM